MGPLLFDSGEYLAEEFGIDMDVMQCQSFQTVLLRHGSYWSDRLALTVLLVNHDVLPLPTECLSLVRQHCDHALMRVDDSFCLLSCLL